MMRFTQFQIKNYKGIDDAVIDLEGEGSFNVSTLVGINESGKTSVLDAIYFFEKDDESKAHTLIPKKHKLVFDDSITVAATLALDDADEAKLKTVSPSEFGYTINDHCKVGSITITKCYKFENSTFKGADVDYEFNVIGRKKGSSKKDEQLSASDPKHRLIGEYLHKNMAPRIVYYQNFLFDFPDQINLSPQPGEDSQQEFYRGVIQDILHSIDPRLNIKNSLISRLESSSPGDAEALKATVTKMGTQITEGVVTTWGRMFNWGNKRIVVGHGEKELAPQPVAEGETPPPLKSYYLEISLEEGSEPYKISERSLGFNWFFAFLLFTQFRKSRKADPGETLFLLDEPASNLHSTAQKKLPEVFEKLADSSKLIYSTHSHHLIRGTWLENAYIVQNTAMKEPEKGLEFDTTKTNIKIYPYKQFVANNPEQRSYFQPVLDALEYQPSDLEMVPKLVIVEGKNDYYTFRYMNEVFFDAEKIHFYPGNGAGQNHAVIRLYEAWGMDYLVVLDSDNAGSKAKERYIEEIGPFIEDKIFTLEDFVSNMKGKSTEDLYYKTDREKIAKLLDPKARYTKKRFNSSMQTLVFQKKKITLTKITQKHFEMLLGAIRRQLG